MQSLITSNNLTMSSREIAELVESRHDSVKRTIERLSEQGLISFTPTVETSHEGSGARPVEVYQVNKRDSYVVVAQLSPAFTARLVDRWQELESMQAPKVPTTYIEALQALLESEKAKQEAQQIASIAIATKAEIGSRREATAMNTARQAVKKANALEIELDKSKTYCTIKRMEMLTHGQKYNWRVLKSACIDVGIEPIPVFDANYGSVKAYHKDVWLEAYAINLDLLS
jgi:phage regulator Rha-like protein